MSTGPPVRAFVVEDEGIVLLELTLVLGELGYSIAGTAADLPSGLAQVGNLDCDVAVLDFNLCGQDSTPIADALEARNIPFVFVSGYTRSTLPERHAHREVVSKPCSAAAVDAAIKRVLKITH